MTAMPKVASGTVELTWDEESRVASIRFAGETNASGKDAKVLVAALTEWIGIEPRPFGLLGDGKGLRSLDAEYRSVWGRFMRTHRDHCCAAFFHMGPIVRVAADMFRIGTGLRLKAFADEAAARAWLREMGIAA